MSTRSEKAKPNSIRYDRTWRALSIVASWSNLTMLGFVWIGVAMAYGAACVRCWHSLESWGGREVEGVGFALLWSGVMALGLSGIHRRFGECLFVVITFFLSFAIGTGWVWATRTMTIWPMDSGMFRYFLDWVASGSYSVEHLAKITWMYDYALWTHRALPLLYPLRIWCGAEHFALVVQFLQVALGSVTLVIAWRIARLLGGREAAKWTVWAILSMPGFGMQAVGLNHQVWGMCWFVSGVWLWVEWFHGGMNGMKRCLVLGFFAVVLGPLLKWEGFVWPGYLSCGLLIAAGHAMWQRDIRNSLAGVAVLVVLPVAVVLTTTSAMERRIESANPQSINGGQMSFIARGWDFQAWGEYSERIEKVDILTPPAEKAELFMRFIAAQVAYNGMVLFQKLFPVKLSKYMLAGYASMAEEILQANGANCITRLARGMRVGWFLLLYAPWLLWGLCNLTRRVGDGYVAPLLIPVALFGVAVMFVGETSPRYAISIQPLLFAAGSCGWTIEGGSGRGGFEMVRFLGGLGAALMGYLIVALLMLGLHGVWGQYALTDMRKAVLEGGQVSEEPFQAPFEAVFPEGEGVVTWEGQGGKITLYLWGRSWRERVKAEVESKPGEWQTVELPMRLESSWEMNTDRRLAIRRVEGIGPLHIGYIDIRRNGQ